MRDTIATESNSHGGDQPENAAASNEAKVEVERRFEVPEELFDAFATGQIVVFAGAGVSTESGFVGPMTFFEEIAGQMGLDPRSVPFPSVMTAYCDRYGRASLLASIAERLEYVRALPELQTDATVFHRELSTLYSVHSIVTTNWDTLFEDVCGARPIVIPGDYEFWDAPGRKVFKLHGSITNWGTVVATEADYRRCYSRINDGIIGASLRQLLAGKRLLFVGYSLGDGDFARVYEFVRAEIGDALRRAYIVAPDEPADITTYEGATVLPVSAELFLSRIKERFVSEGHLLDDRRYEETALKLREVNRERARLAQLTMREHPEVIYTHSYQDGVLHALQRVVANFRTGEYSDPAGIERMIINYDEIRQAKARVGAYWDVAYLIGYGNALAWLVADDSNRAPLPLYFVFGAEALYSFDTYEAIAKRSEQLHEPAYGVARRLASRYQDGTTALRHTPWVG